MEKMRRKDLEIHDQKEIEAILSKAGVCRIGMVDGNKPYIVAMNFGYENDGSPRLWFHGATKGRKIDIIRRNPEVFFQVDIDHQLITAKDACDFSMLFRSVTGNGKITIIEHVEEKIHGLQVIMAHYTGSRDYTFSPEMLSATAILRMDINDMTGKKKV